MNMFLVVVAIFGLVFWNPTDGMLNDEDRSLLVTQVNVREIRKGDIGLYIG